MSAFWLVSVAEHVSLNVRQHFGVLKTVVSLDGWVSVKIQTILHYN